MQTPADGCINASRNSTNLVLTLNEMIAIGRLHRSMQVRAVVLTYLTVLTISQTQTPLTFEEATFNSGQNGRRVHRN